MFLIKSNKIKFKIREKFLERHLKTKVVLYCDDLTK